MLTQKIFAASQNGAELILWILLILSVISVGMIIERFFSLRSLRSTSLKVKKRIQDALQSNSLKDLEDIARDKETLEGRALSYALRHMKENQKSGISEIFNSFILMEKANLEKYLNFLATVGSNAPFIGLLGTVFGIMRAFHDLGISQGSNGASMVMGGIAEALVSTAVGLLVAIPAVIAYNYFQRQVKGSLQSLESLREVCVAYAKTLGSTNG